MELPAAAEVLFEAQRARSTGRLHLVSQGRRAELLLSQGDLVGARVGFGHLTLAQALMQEGVLDAAGLDALWAIGNGDGSSMSGLPLPGTSAHELHWRSQVRALVHL